MYTPARDGNWSGRGLLSWEDVRIMSYKDREYYLGSTVNLGFLDKGGRWRKRDWWTKPVNDPNGTSNDLQEEIKRIKEEEQQRMDEALGLRPVEKPQPTGLSQTELQEITQKGQSLYDPEAAGLKVTGLGFTKPVETPKRKHHHKEDPGKKRHKRHRDKHHHD